MKKNFKLRNGYTLIELVVVMALLITVGGLIVGILSSTIKGDAKSKITNDLGQNGNYAISVLSDVILNSQNFQSIDGATSCAPTGTVGSSIIVVGFDGGVSTLSCSDASGTISFNSASLLDTTRVRLVPGTCRFTCVQQDAYSAPRIDISFQLQSANGSSAETIGLPTSFNTSLSLRNKSIK